MPFARASATTGPPAPIRGTGIIGLKDSVEELGGTTTVHGPDGVGPSLHAEFPLAA